MPLFQSLEHDEAHAMGVLRSGGFREQPADPFMGEEDERGGYLLLEDIILRVRDHGS